jgi:glutamate 5-kinase
MTLHNAKRIVIKTGSSLMIDEETGGVREAWLATVAADIAKFMQQGKEVIVVTSGAVALGRRVLGWHKKVLKLEEKQAAAACGQIHLVQAWRSALGLHAIQTAQVLLTIDESDDRRRFLNAKNTLETLLEARVVPIINENDTVATAELRVGDNDRLSARVAQMVAADWLVLLSDIDGLYSANPKTNASATLIELVKQITPDIEAMAGGAVSNVGSGGMITKIQAAKIALAAGCHMTISDGKIGSPLRALVDGRKHTWFKASESPLSARKHWISGSIAANGAVVLDDGAKTALLSAKSLLPAGVKAVEGNFERGDAVEIKDASGKILGKGLIAYNAADTRRIMGHKSGEIETILGFKGRDTLIHRDDMAIH